MGEVAGPLPGGGGGSHVWAGGPQGSAMKRGTAQMTPEPPFRGQRHSLSPLIRKMELFLCSQHPSLPLRQVWASLLWGSLLLPSGSWCIRFCLCPLRVYFPVLCKLWQLYGGVNGDLLKEGLCHTQVCWIPEPLSQ